MCYLCVHGLDGLLSAHICVFHTTHTPPPLTPSSRLTHTWSYVSADSVKTFTEAKNKYSPAKNFVEYRKIVSDLQTCEQPAACMCDHDHITSHSITSHYITLFHITLYHITSHYISHHSFQHCTSYTITSLHIISTSPHITIHHHTHHIISSHTTPHHITTQSHTSHHITTHHITSHHPTHSHTLTPFSFQCI